MIQWPSTCLASRTCTPHAGAHPDFFHTLKLVVLDLKSKPATENEAEPVNLRICYSNLFVDSAVTMSGEDFSVRRFWWSLQTIDNALNAVAMRRF
jgi:hypothetical protein